MRGPIREVWMGPRTMTITLKKETKRTAAKNYDGGAP